jgi:hypothetical protein
MSFWDMKQTMLESGHERRGNWHVFSVGKTRREYESNISLIRKGR